MTITAKFNSKCPICGKQIQAGSKVQWQPGQKATCINCTESAGTPAQSNTTTDNWLSKDHCGCCGCKLEKDYKNCISGQDIFNKSKTVSLHCPTCNSIVTYK